MTGFLEAFLAALTAFVGLLIVSFGHGRQALRSEAKWRANGVAAALFGFAALLPLMVMGLAPPFLPMAALPAVMAALILLLLAVALSGLVRPLAAAMDKLFGAMPGRARQIAAAVSAAALLFFLS